MIRRLAPFGLVIGAAVFGFRLGIKVTTEAAIQLAAEREAWWKDRVAPFAYLFALREAFGDLSTDVVSDGSDRPNCGYCGAKRPDGVTGDINLHVDGPWHHEHCPYFDPALGTPPPVRER